MKSMDLNLNIQVIGKKNINNSSADFETQRKGELFRITTFSSEFGYSPDGMIMEEEKSRLIDGYRYG